MASSRRRPPSLLSRTQLLCALLALPGVLFAVLWMWVAKMGTVTSLLMLAALLLYSLLLAAIFSETLTHRLRTLSNVLSALREEDYSFRARDGSSPDALGELAAEINTLADMLQHERLQTREASALLARIVEVMDAPLFAFDTQSRLRLVNPAGERLLPRPASSLGQSAEKLGLAALLGAEDESIVTVGTSPAKWLLRRSRFRQSGMPHQLLVLSDVSTPLRDEERVAWQRLIRVLGHELSNSLAPIKSIAESLASRVPALQLAPEATADFRRGLEIIEARAEALHRFVQGYRALAQLPPPEFTQTELRPLLERVAAMETRVKVLLEAGPAISLKMDPDQIEQMLINLLRNAAEASLENGKAEVTMGWQLDEHRVCIFLLDEGRGIANPDNLFVPFYTTKPQGNGVGLVLARQIAHAHLGSLRLLARTGVEGTRAEISLPL